MSMLDCNCNCRCRCNLTALIASLLIGVIAAFLQITGVLTVSTTFLWAAFIIAVVFLAILILSAAVACRNEPCACLCTNLRSLLAGALGTILFALVLLLIDVAARTVIGAILVGLLLFFFALLFAGAACLIKCLANCRD
ncbi:MAG: hypothetical protein ACI4MP_00440 [Candidatus Ventricola sp.]